MMPIFHNSVIPCGSQVDIFSQQRTISLFELSRSTIIKCNLHTTLLSQRPSSYLLFSFSLGSWDCFRDWSKDRQGQSRSLWANLSLLLRCGLSSLLGIKLTPMAATDIYGANVVYKTKGAKGGTVHLISDSKSLQFNWRKEAEYMTEPKKKKKKVILFS